MKASTKEIEQDRVLITDPGGCQGALPTVRSLGKRNVASFLLTQKGVVPSLFSRWHSERIYCPSSTEDLEGFVASLLQLVKTRRYLTIFPLGDNSLIPISERRGLFTPYLKLALPSHESVAKVIDKSQTLNVAKKIGIPIPHSFFPSTPAEVRTISREILYPAVIKPRRSFVWDLNGKALYSRPCFVNSASELLSTYSKVNENFPAPLIQEYIPGFNISAALLFDRGELKAACFIRVYRAIPTTGGTSVLRESVPPDSTLLSYASDLLREMRWHGVAEVEFRIDSRDLTPKLMEVNARFWASMNVAIESGVDFPYLLYMLTKGEKVPSVFSYRSGVKFRWIGGDTLNLISTLKDRRKQSAQKLNTLGQFVKFYEKNIHYDGLSASDPLPFFMNEASFIYNYAKNMARTAKKVLIKNAI